ncbi:MAG: HD domain-containing protein [Eubacterium sp.]|nr:HD domain-containing protein [Eubacterium sp.]
MAEDKTARALALAKSRHAGQRRFGGAAYIVHPVAVAEDLKGRGYGEDYYITALCHDLLEDTDTSEAEIAAVGGGEVLRAVQLLTKPRPYDMGAYLGGIQKNPLAKAVKCADRLDNLRDCVQAPLAFQKKYYAESLRWYRAFMAGTPFEADFEAALVVLGQKIVKKTSKSDEKD